MNKNVNRTIRLLGLLALALAFLPFLRAQEGSKMNVGELMGCASGHVDQQVRVHGKVIHVCQHGGKRLRLRSGDAVVQVSRSESDSGVFAKELLGKQVVLRGIVREHRLTRTYLEGLRKSMEAEAAGEEGEEGTAPEHDHHEALEGILKKLKDLDESGRDYLPAYSLEFMGMDQD